jgi:hypothetical protein
MAFSLRENSHFCFAKGPSRKKNLLTALKNGTE